MVPHTVCREQVADHTPPVGIGPNPEVGAAVQRPACPERPSGCQQPGFQVLTDAFHEGCVPQGFEQLTDNEMIYMKS